MASPDDTDQIPSTEVLDGYRDEAATDYYTRRTKKEHKEALVAKLNADTKQNLLNP